MPRRTFIPGVGFPLRLERFLAQKRLTPNIVQRDTGVSSGTIGHWLRGESYPSRNLYYGFCRFYNIRPLALLRREGEPALTVPGKASRCLAAYFERVEYLAPLLPDLTAAEQLQLLQFTRKLIRLIKAEQENYVEEP